MYGTYWFSCMCAYHIFIHNPPQSLPPALASSSPALLARSTASPWHGAVTASQSAQTTATRWTVPSAPKCSSSVTKANAWTFSCAATESPTAWTALMNRIATVCPTVTQFKPVTDSVKTHTILRLWARQEALFFNRMCKYYKLTIFVSKLSHDLPMCCCQQKEQYFFTFSQHF